MAQGEAFLIKKEEPLVIEKKTVLDIKVEKKRFHNSLEIAKNQIRDVKGKMAEQLADSELQIYDAHIAILEDPELIDKTEDFISSQNCCADFALHTISSEYIQILKELDDDYMSARAKDIEEVSTVVIKSLQGKLDSTIIIDEPIILLAHTISTHFISTMDSQFVMGIVTAGGGATDHSSILYNALSIPAIVGVGKELESVEDLTPILLDADDGIVMFNPDQEAIQSFNKRYENHRLIENTNLRDSHLPAKTISGKQIKIYANIGNAKEAKVAQLRGADGVGLLRTEFCFLDRISIPTEEEQFEMYKAMLDEFPHKEVVVRLIDIGSDKKVSYIQMEEEENPALGMRALRLGFKNYESLLRPQIRALLRLSASYNIRLLFPMIASLNDLIEIKDAIQNEIITLEKEGIKINKSMPLGIMVEVPNVALRPELFVDEVDFFSFGTNDLAQYVMAADRTNSFVSNYIPEAIPAILYMIEHVVAVAHAKGKWVGICGGLAADTNLTERFINLGVDELSMPSSVIPKMKAFIRKLT